MGDCSIINPGSVIGGGGFGFSQDSTKAWHKIPQCGGVVISENVEMVQIQPLTQGHLIQL